MGNWNRHFVRVGPDGNMGVYDQKGNRFIRENVGSDNLPAQIVIIPSSQDNNGGTFPPEVNSIGFMSDTEGNPRINPNTDMLITLGNSNIGFFQGKIGSEIFSNYNGVNLSMSGIAALAGNPDLRTGVTAADASPITIFSSTQSGTRYEVKARILATAGSSATYTISWTEGGVTQSVALTITAVDTEVHDNFVIAPDANTDITAQITALTSSTVNVDAIVSVLG